MQVGEAPGAGGRAMQQQPSVVLAPEAGHSTRFRFSRPKARIVLRIAAARGGAEPPDRADRALRPVPDAHEGAQLHHGLVVSAGVGRREESLSEAREVAGRGGIVTETGAVGGEPGEDADDVPVDAGHGRAEGEAGDRRRGIGSDTRQFPPDLWGTGGRGQVVNRPGQPVKVAGAGVVAKAFPQLEHLGLGGGGEGGEIG